MKDLQEGQNIILEGISVSEGIGFGTVNIYRTDFDDVTKYDLAPGEVIAEIDRFSAALLDVDLIFQNNQKRVARELGLEQSKIYDTYHLILKDPLFQKEIPMAIRSQLQNAESVICEKLGLYEKHFSTIEDEYLRERIFDIRGVSRRLVYHLLQHEGPEQKDTSESNIIIARELTPADSIHFHHKTLKGLVTEFGGRTSHAAILARSMEVPAIVGVKDLLKNTPNHAPVIIDGTAGKLIIYPNNEQIKFYRARFKKLQLRKRQLLQNLSAPITGLPGRPIRFLANLNELSEIPVVQRYKAQGIGLFRTELQFIARERLLTENEQYHIYSNVIQSFGESEVVIRVLDIGGDKFFPFSDIQKESNPFLGWRSIRILLTERDIFKTQLKAIFRAAVHGRIKILIPMISSVEEIVETKTIINEVLDELQTQKVEHRSGLPLGIMVEIPSAAIMIDKLLKEVDFVSIGTNDLIQYTLAVDRNNDKVASFYQPLNLGVLALIKKVVDEAKSQGKDVSICGEMAGDPLYTQLLLALGINDFSMQPVSIPKVNDVVLHTDIKRLDRINKKVFGFCKTEELRRFLLEGLPSELLEP